MWAVSGFYAKGSPGLNFINVVRVWIFINVVRVRILSRIESRSGFYWCSPGPSPDYINQSPGVSPNVFCVSAPDFINFSVRVWILSSKSGSGCVSRFYSIRVRVRVWILSSMSGSGSGFYQHPSNAH